MPASPVSAPTTTAPIAAPSTPAAPTVPSKLEAVSPSNLPFEQNKPLVHQKPARQKFYQGLEKMAADKSPASTPEKTVEPEKKTSAPVPTEEKTPPVEGGEPGVTPDANENGSPPAGDKTTPPATEGKPAKANPWKLYEAEKTARANAEKQIQELKSQLVPETERKAYEEKLSKLEARSKELEDEIRFVDYRKSKEFQEKYQQPYEEAIKRAMTELSEITITDSAGVQRPTDVKDLLQLVAMPIEQARNVADEVFGKFADDVMAFRKEVKQHLANQNAALEDAKKNGGERDKLRQEQIQRATIQLKESVSKLWKEVNDAALNDEKFGQYFKPREGDEDWNRRLAKGFERTEKALAESAFNPNLTPEERKAILERHAAMKYRAASWGAVRNQLEKALAKNAELQKKLEQFQKSVPTPGGSEKPSTTPVQTGSAKQRFMAGLDKLVK